MRLNKFIAMATNLSRRAADDAINQSRVSVNGALAQTGQQVDIGDKIELDKRVLHSSGSQTILFHKPTGYVCSRNGQGGKTIYELLPLELRNLKSVGRLDKDSSGLILLTSNGTLAHQLTHPSFQKKKVYIVKLNRQLAPEDFAKISKQGVMLADGLSKLDLNFINDQNIEWKVTMHEGRNRQIRRTFEALGYRVLSLHRIRLGNYSLDELLPGKYKTV